MCVHSFADYGSLNRDRGFLPQGGNLMNAHEASAARATREVHSGFDLITLAMKHALDDLWFVIHDSADVSSRCECYLPLTIWLISWN